MTRKVIIYILVLLLTAGTRLILAQEIPEQPVPPRLVVDYTNTLGKGQVDRLERRLVNFNDTTSTQISVVLVPSLNGLTKEEFADQLAEKWGVGRRGKDNGVVVLVKPKTQRERGEARISVGYGLEGAIPDAIAKRIVENEMIPSFKQNDYYTGLYEATSVIMGLTAGEFTADEYRSRTGGDSKPGIFLFIFFLVIFIILGRIGRRSRRYYGSGSRGSTFLTALLLGSMLSNRGSSGSWGNFRSGSGGFGGGGGGFGGFGGGSFGGGGAGGSW